MAEDGSEGATRKTFSVLFKRRSKREASAPTAGPSSSPNLLDPSKQGSSPLSPPTRDVSCMEEPLAGRGRNRSQSLVLKDLGAAPPPPPVPPHPPAEPTSPSHPHPHLPPSPDPFLQCRRPLSRTIEVRPVLPLFSGDPLIVPATGPSSSAAQSEADVDGGGMSSPRSPRVGTEVLSPQSPRMATSREGQIREGGVIGPKTHRCNSSVLQSIDPRSNAMRTALLSVRRCMSMRGVSVEELKRAVASPDDEWFAQLLKTLATEKMFLPSILQASDEFNHSVLYFIKRPSLVTLLVKTLSPASLRSALNRQKDDSFTTPLQKACESGNFEVAMMYLELGADANSYTERNMSALALALCCRLSSQQQSPAEFERLRFDLVQRLITVAPATINTPSIRLMLPLHHAVLIENLDAVNLLLQKGSLSNLPDALGNLPLHYAIRCGNPQIVERLVEEGAHLIHMRYPFVWGSHSTELGCSCPVDHNGHIPMPPGGILLTASPYQLCVQNVRLMQKRKDAAQADRFVKSRKVLDRAVFHQIRGNLQILDRPFRPSEDPFERIPDAYGDGSSIDDALVLNGADFAQATFNQFQAEHGSSHHLKYGATMPLQFWLTALRTMVTDLWGEPCYRLYLNRANELFVEAYFAASYGAIISLYDEEYAVQNSALTQMTAWLTHLNPRKFGVRSKDVLLWFPQFFLARSRSSYFLPSAPAVVDTHAEKQDAAAKCLAEAAQHLVRFTAARSPIQKAQTLHLWSHTILSGLERVGDGLVDPDLLLFLRGWSFSAANIPNPSSQLMFLRSFLLDGLDPEVAEIPSESNDYVDIILTLQRTIEAVRSMRNTKKWLVIKVEGGIVSNMSSAPPSSMNLLLSILGTFQDPVTLERHSFRFKGTGHLPLLGWLARDWDLTLSEDIDADVTIVTVNNPDEFPLTPHVCEEIILKLSRFTR